MHTRKYNILLLFLYLFLSACADKKDQRDIASNPEDLQERVEDLLKNFADTVNAPPLPFLDSSIVLNQPGIARFLYKRNVSGPFWSNKDNWKPEGDSLFAFINSAQLFGLFPEDYHRDEIKEIRNRFSTDSLGKKDRKNVLLWTKAEILLTDAFIHIIRDLYLGRLPNDSISLSKDSVLTEEFLARQLDEMNRQGFSAMISALEPRQRGYHLLKAGIKKFLDSAEYRSYTPVPYPEKDISKFTKALQSRLYEGGFISFDSVKADSAQLAEAVKSFQKKKGLAVDGRAGEATVRMMNVNDREKFIRIAISLDKYKKMPRQMPSKYIWVNASANLLELVDQGEVKLRSKVICGKAKTRTPVLTSQISELITYPQWVPPPSIVSKEILPAVKRNPGYLARKGFRLVDSKGNTIDPYSVNWSRYGSAIPYRIIQGSGDANALGIMKFVFNNKYSVYLHDTNQRYLFSSSNRSLSHGCVRVQEWEKLTWYLLRNDNLSEKSGQDNRVDSVKSWLSQKQKRSIALRNKVPLYIRYLTCEGENGNIVFYDDVYSEDKMLREKYFSTK